MKGGILIKKKVLAVFLSVCVTLGVVTITSAAVEQPVAQIGNTTYTTLEEAIESARTGDTVTLLQDVELDPTYAIDRIDDGYEASKYSWALMTVEYNITLDLNGKTISWDTDVENFDEIWYCAIFFQNFNADLILTGNGYIDAACGPHNGMVAIMRASRSVINDGTYTGAPFAFLVEGGNITINGGKFIEADTYDIVEKDGTEHIVDCVDGSYDAWTARIYINGGSFCFDPSDNPEGENTTYLNTERHSTPIMWEVS